MPISPTTAANRGSRKNRERKSPKLKGEDGGVHEQDEEVGFGGWFDLVGRHGGVR
jgi:hypothetical protein